MSETLVISIRDLVHPEEAIFVKEYLMEQMQFFYGRPLTSPKNDSYNFLWEETKNQRAGLPSLYGCLVATSSARVGDTRDILGTLLYRPLLKADVPQHMWENQLLSHPLSDMTYLHGVYIREDMRGHGVGNQLFKRGLEDIARASYKEIFLHTHAFLPGGSNFWHKQGFIDLEVTHDEYETIYMHQLVTS